MSSPITNINVLLKQVERVLTPIFNLVLGTDYTEIDHVSADHQKNQCMYPYQSDESFAAARAELHILGQRSHVLFFPEKYLHAEPLYTTISYRPPKDHFQRNIQTQRKRYEQSRMRKNIYDSYVPIANVEKIDEQIWIENKQKKVVMKIDGHELLYLKQNIISDRVILNYLNFLATSEILSPRVYIFDFSFLPALMGSHLCESQLSKQMLNAIVIKNYEAMKLKLQVDIFAFDNLVIPLEIGKHYSCFIIHGINLLLQKGTPSSVIHCDNKNISLPCIPDALRTLLQLQLGVKKRMNICLTANNMPFVQLLLPREINSCDSPFYMMLNIQFLLDRESGQLNQLKMLQRRRKLHLYPRLLIFTMGQRVWNLFARLLKQRGSDKLAMVAGQFVRQRKKNYEKSSLQLDFDRIDKNELKKYQLLNKQIVDEKKDEETKFSYELKYYFDRSINYYEDEM